MRNILIGLLASTLVLGACGGKKKDGDKKQGAKTAKEVGGDKGGDQVASKGGGDSAAAAEATKLVPKELAGKLEFTTAKGEDDRFAAVVPKGWEEGKHFPGLYKPTGTDMGFMSKYSVGTNCDGDCAPKDWPATTDKIEFKQFTEGDQFTVEKDEKSDGRRILIARTGEKVYLNVAWWKDGASRYFTCSATLDREIAGAVAAFEKACLGMSINSW